MLNTILVANDGSDEGFAAFTFALELAYRFERPLYMLMVKGLPVAPITIAEVDEKQNEAAARIEPVVERARKLAALKKVRLNVEIVSGYPVRSITNFIGDHGIDHLVIGSTKEPSFYKQFIGGTVARLVRLAPCSVTIVK